MVKHTVKVSTTIHQMRIHDIGEQSKVAELVHGWILDDQSEKKTWSEWADLLRKNLKDQKTFAELSLAPAAGLAVTKRLDIITKEHRNPNDAELRVLSLRGHIFDDAALKIVADLFPDSDTKLALLKQARDADAAAWKRNLRTKVLQSNDPSTFINALAVYYGHITFSDIREDFFLEKNLESLGVEYQKFVFRWSGNLESIVLEPEFIEWFKKTYDMPSDPAINERFDNMVTIKGVSDVSTSNVKAAPSLSDLEIKEAKKTVERFRNMLVYGFEKSKMNPSDFFNLTVSEAMQVDPSLVPIKISGSVAKAYLGTQYQWPDTNQLEALCAKFKEASEANPRDKWFDAPYFSPRDKFSPASGRPFADGLRDLYAQASQARAQLIAIGQEGKGGVGGRG